MLIEITEWISQITFFMKALVFLMFYVPFTFWFMRLVCGSNSQKEIDIYGSRVEDLPEDFDFKAAMQDGSSAKIPEE